MIRRNTQTTAYWRESFKINLDDLEYLGNYLLEKETPQTSEALTLALIEYRCQREESKIRSELSKGEIYQPSKAYRTGQQVVFPAFEYTLGTITSVRKGSNPEHGEFDVVQVMLEGQAEPREFAGSLKTAHRLSRTDGETVETGERLQTPRDLYSQYGGSVRKALVEQLRASTQPAFVQDGDQWLTREALVEVHVGHLNIAEALIEMKTQPITTTVLLTEMGLPTEVPEHLRRFSTNAGLRQDERFDDVGSGTEPSWYLRRLQPPEVWQTPSALRYEPIPYDRLALGVEMLQQEWELDDEWSTDGISVDTPMVVPTITLNLIFPHLRSGTLPLSGRAQGFFPRGLGRSTMITLVDGRWGARFAAFVCHEGRYIAGLGGWLEQHKLPVGAIITLERTREPLEYVVDFRPRRPRREWSRTAEIRDGELAFALQKQSINCDYDEHLTVAEISPGALDAYRQTLATERVPLSRLVRQLAQELAGKSPQGTVHAKTIYSAVNLVRRSPPGPIFAILATDSTLRSMSGGYWAMAVRAS
ncbi:hypothetical protein [Candidatus Amarolinea dominans]|uniref:hypothetical protein n=1 Tax=Candidatus Amarolinea dominans TaxID=3140696 RepID=UPI001D6FA459|nr:hypothetical protein [Anaerolineae bacterium]MBK7200996.1 hypothetical protein [Anaerolineae bacterium]